MSSFSFVGAAEFSTLETGIVSCSSTRYSPLRLVAVRMAPHTPPPPERNAATSMSMTPYQLKTASIPTSARVYSAVPLNLDLTNELEGATVVEKDKRKGSKHYILHPYDHLPPSHTTAPDPATIMRNNEPLYNSATESWDPSYLPHILRNSPSQTGQGKRKKRKKKSSTSVPPPTDPDARTRSRSMTITREYHGTQGPVTETQEGTYLPTAGSEESKVAQWLNYIAESLCIHYKSSSSKAAHQVRQESV